MNYAAPLEAHYAKHWATPAHRLRWDRGPVHELPNDFRVLVVRVSPTMTAFATVCLSQPEDDERLELHMFTSADETRRDQIVELLTVVAHYHRTGARLGLHHSVNFGRPWLPGSRCTHGLISLPYLDGPKLEWLDELEVRFLWLVPITQGEVDFKKAHGTDALQRRFEEHQFDYLDPMRQSVV